MVLVIIINKNLRRKTRTKNPAQCYESLSEAVDGFIVLAQSVLYVFYQWAVTCIGLLTRVTEVPQSVGLLLRRAVYSRCVQI